ncbi:hypothetical protein HW555_010714 [Spodoptera exigua]|uniref:MORN repeat-containing protein 5 n=1 Tax=Spodoptera exigua TaxID=7107 RepID=A0A835G8H9_SPOEX|nr:hypothetical protein HW555_010714 [Spodoptera exigua]
MDVCFIHKITMGTSNKRGSQWQELMQSFCEKRKETCRASSIEAPVTKSVTKQFKTKSKYKGGWGPLGMTGYGEYTFPNGCSIIRGVWENGVMKSRTLRFSDTLEYDEYKWKYCVPPDRRFDIEYQTSIQPAGKSYLTAQQPTNEIPPGYYDTGDGLYSPNTKVVYNYHDLTSIKRATSEQEQRWIVENCRFADLGPLGPRPDMYETYQQPTDLLTPPPPPPTTSIPKIISSQFDMEYHTPEKDFYDPSKFSSPSTQKLDQKLPSNHNFKK